MAIPPVGALGGITQLTQATSPTAATSTQGAQGAQGPSFAKTLDAAANLGVQADLMAAQVSTGQLPNIQAFTTAAAKAELAVDLAVAVRNRAIEAYQEIMRMSV